MRCNFIPTELDQCQKEAVLTLKDFFNGFGKNLDIKNKSMLKKINAAVGGWLTIESLDYMPGGFDRINGHTKESTFYFNNGEVNIKIKLKH